MIVVIGLPEVIACAADYGLIDAPRLRRLMVQNGAFWPGLLDDWQANYPAQPVTMFLSYSFLHAGIVHLAGNMAILLWVGPMVVERMGVLGFLVSWVASSLAGAVTFAVLTSGISPMVGASGSIFGLIGSIIALLHIQQGRHVLAIGITTGLIAMNVAAFISQDGILAWEAHLGGFLGGLLVGALWHDRAKPA